MTINNKKKKSLRSYGILIGHKKLGLFFSFTFQLAYDSFTNPEFIKTSPLISEAWLVSFHWLEVIHSEKKMELNC